MKYDVYLTTTATTHVQIEAESEDEARDKAYDAEMPDICAQCSSWGPPDKSLELGDEWTVSDVMEASS